MADKGKQAPVIIIKKKGGHGGGHHGGAWKVAYADFVTAMMAFFLVMWLVVQSEKVKVAVAGYFQDPVTYTEKVKRGVLDGGVGMMDTSGGTQFTVIKEADQGGSGEGDNITAALEQAGREILDAMSSSADLQQLAGQIDVEITKEGLRIELVEARDSSFFEVGSPRLSPAGVKAVRAIAGVVGKLDMEVAVEGHTDSRPYAGGKGGYSNWELSADRANAARGVLETSGIDARRIREVRGYADKSLRYPDVPSDARNRRVSVIVFNKFYAAQKAKEAAQKEEVRKLTPSLAPMGGGR